MNPLAPVLLVVMHLDLPAGPLEDSAIAVCKTWEVTCQWSDGMQNVTVGALRGDFRLNDALKALTHSTGFSYDFYDFEPYVEPADKPVVDFYHIEECHPLWESDPIAHMPESTCYGPLTKPDPQL